MPRQNMIKTLSQLLTIAPSLSPQVTHLKDPDMFWDFISLMPMTTHQVRLFLHRLLFYNSALFYHQVSFLFSDRGTPNGYRFMNG